MEHPEVFIVFIISLLFSIFCIVEQFYNVFYSVRLSIMGLMIPFKCVLHMQRLWPGGRGVLDRCWFSVDPASRRSAGIALGGSALIQLLVSCFLFILLQSGIGILLGGAFV